MRSKHSQRTLVNDDGNPVIPADVARQYGIRPGRELFLDEKDDGIFLRRPISHLAKIYTNQLAIAISPAGLVSEILGMSRWVK